MPSDLLDQKKSLERRTYQLMFKILIIFGAPAAIAFFLGQWIDARFQLDQLGSMAALLCSFVFSWIITIRLYLMLEKERKEIEAQEASEQDI